MRFPPVVFQFSAHEKERDGVFLFLKESSQAFPDVTSHAVLGTQNGKRLEFLQVYLKL